MPFFIYQRFNYPGEFFLAKYRSRRLILFLMWKFLRLDGFQSWAECSTQKKIPPVYVGTHLPRDKFKLLEYWEETCGLWAAIARWHFFRALRAPAAINAFFYSPSHLMNGSRRKIKFDSKHNNNIRVTKRRNNNLIYAVRLRLLLFLQ